MKLKLDSVLLFALLIPFIMTYRISPGDTPYSLFGLIFLGLLGYVSLDFIKVGINLYNRLKLVLFWVLLIASVGSAFFAAIVVRHKTSPIYNVHDIVIQQELAIRMLIHGTNPYSATYFGTPLEKWHYSDTEVNPALYHFVMQPFYLIFAIPFYFPISHTIGWFDARTPLFFLFFATLFMAQKLVKDEDRKRSFLTLLAYNPATLGYTLEGRSDFFMFAFLFASLFLLYKRKLLLSGIPMVLALAVKQSAWPILPFYIAYIFLKSKSIGRTISNLSLFIVTFGAVVVPFLIWDYRSFLDSTVFYLSGSAQNSYPISGYGFGKVLNELGMIKDVHEYFPFHFLQLLIGVPLFFFLLKNLKRNLSVGRLVIVYGIFLFVFWYFSRYFNNSHIAYLSTIFITAYFWPQDKS